MPDRTAFSPGEFCWWELATTDAPAAKAFYSELFGWSCDEQPIGDGSTYGMLSLGGKPIGALYGIGKERAARGEPTHWSVYVAVADVDASAKRVGELSGELLAPPFDVMDVGRMAVLKDPSGAALALWQAKKHFGAALVGELGSFCWSELMTTDVGKAETFYTSLFGWTAKHGQGGDPYVELVVADRHQGGMRALSDGERQMGMPSSWLAYVMVASCADASAKAAKLGATLLVPPMSIPHAGTFSVLRDPTGGVVATYERTGSH